MSSNCQIKCDTLSNPVLSTKHGDPFYVRDTNAISNVIENGRLLLSQVIDVERYVISNKHSGIGFDTHYEILRFRVFKSETESVELVHQLQEGTRSGLDYGDYVRVLYLDDLNVLWEYSAFRDCYIRYDINSSTETLPYEVPLPETDWGSLSDKDPIASQDNKFICNSRVKRDTKMGLLIGGIAILLTLAVAVGSYMLSPDAPVCYAFGGVALLFVLYEIYIAVSGTRQLKDEEYVFNNGTLCLARVLEVNKHMHSCSSVRLNVYMPYETICIEAHTSENNMPMVSRGDYVRVLYCDSKHYLIEGNLAKGIFYRYRLNPDIETLRFE